MSDLISRADAIKAVEQEYRVDRGYMVDDYTYGFNQAIQYVSDIILHDLPSVEPLGDLISRADAMGAVQDHFNADGFKGYDDGQKMMDRIKALPSAETHGIRTETHGVCSDLISRADAIEAVCDGCVWYKTASCEEGKEEWECSEVNKIRHLPSAEAEWIPCSERLPKAEDMYQIPEQRYLCQLETHGERKFCVLSRLKGAVSPFWDWYGIAVYDSEVVAWMPLPMPYREESEVEE